MIRHHNVSINFFGFILLFFFRCILYIIIITAVFIMLYACTSDDDVATAPRWPVVHLSGFIHVPVCIHTLHYNKRIRI